MGKTLLLPVDGSPPSEEAVAFAATEWPDADLHAVHVIDPVESGYGTGRSATGGEQWYEEACERAEAYFERATAVAGRELETTIEVGPPASTIVAAAETVEADIVVMGSHGREGLSRLLLGSVAEHVVRESPVPVMIVR